MTLPPALRAVKAQRAQREDEARAAAEAEAEARPNGRAGKVHLGGWLSPSYKTSLRAIQMQLPERDLQSLFAEALNDLFAKYRVPTVSE